LNYAAVTFIEQRASKVRNSKVFIYGAKDAQKGNITSYNCQLIIFKLI